MFLKLTKIQEDFMNKIPIIKYLTIILVFALAFFAVQDAVGQPQEHELIVKKIDNVWRVVQANDETRSDVIVQRGDRIRWVVEGSDASFQFSDDRLFGDGTRRVRDGNPLVLAVRNNSEIGMYTYSVFVHADEEFAVGQSPPRIFVVAD